MSGPGHEELCTSLAEHLRAQVTKWVLIRDLCLGNTWTREHPGIADLVAVELTWSHWECRVFEVKASRADLLRDLRAGKWEKYLEHCTRLYFAFPEHVGQKSDLPPGVGLCVWSEAKGGCWRFLSHPRPRVAEPSARLLRAMLWNLWSYGQGSERRALEIAKRHRTLAAGGRRVNDLLRACFGSRMWELEDAVAALCAQTADLRARLRARGEVVDDDNLGRRARGLRR